MIRSGSSAAKSDLVNALCISEYNKEALFESEELAFQAFTDRNDVEVARGTTNENRKIFGEKTGFSLRFVWNTKNVVL